MSILFSFVKRILANRFVHVVCSRFWLGVGRFTRRQRGAHNQCVLNRSTLAKTTMDFVTFSVLWIVCIFWRVYLFFVFAQFILRLSLLRVVFTLSCNVRPTGKNEWEITTRNTGVFSVYQWKRTDGRTNRAGSNEKTERRTAGGDDGNLLLR